jgi:hypothetical protein
MGYRLIPRAEWLRYASQPFTGPSFNALLVTQRVMHYNGGNYDIPQGDVQAHLRNIAQSHDWYMTRPGDNYAYGYNWVCIPTGDLVVIRGLDYRCAANGCGLVNTPAVAMQVVTDLYGPPTAAQLDAIATLHQTNRAEVIRAAVRLALDLQREAS